MWQRIKSTFNSFVDSARNKLQRLKNAVKTGIKKIFGAAIIATVVLFLAACLVTFVVLPVSIYCITQPLIGSAISATRRAISNIYSKIHFRLYHKSNREQAGKQLLAELTNRGLNVRKNLSIFEINVLVDHLKNNDKISELNLSRCDVCDDGLKVLIDCIKTKSNIKTLDLSGNNITQQGIKCLAGLLEYNHYLTTLKLSNNYISATSAKTLAEALTKNTVLQNLELFGNLISDPGALSFAEILKGNKSLQVLNLGLNNISDRGARGLATSLQQNDSLNKLNLTWNAISDDGADEFKNSIESFSPNIDIDLAVNFKMEMIFRGLGWVGGLLTKCLPYLTSIPFEGPSQSIDSFTFFPPAHVLGNNIDSIYAHDIDAVTGQELINELSDPERQVKTLELYNALPGANVSSLSEAIRSNTTLNSLKISKFNGIEAMYLDTLLEGPNISLTHVHFHKVFFGNTINKLVDCLQNNKIICTFNAVYCNITDDIAVSIKKALLNNNTLKTLNLFGNKISDDGIMAIINAMNLSLISLDLSGQDNYHKFGFLSKVEQAVKEKNTHRKELVFAWNQLRFQRELPKDVMDNNIAPFLNMPSGLLKVKIKKFGSSLT